MDLLSEWRQATAPMHRELDTKLGVMSEGFSRQDYAKLLLGFYAFYFPFENLLKSLAGASEAADFYLDGREKLPALKRDLKFWGLDDGQLEDLSLAPLPVSWRERPAALWGSLYVVEGSTLGGQVMAAHLEKKFSLGAGNGLEFYRVYGPEQAARWQAFKALVPSLRLDAADREATVRAAVETFRLIADQISSR